MEVVGECPAALVGGDWETVGRRFSLAGAMIPAVLWNIVCVIVLSRPSAIQNYIFHRRAVLTLSW